MTCSCTTQSDDFRILPFPLPNNLEDQRSMARSLAIGKQKAVPFAETLYATTNSGLFATASVIGEESDSWTGQKDDPMIFGILGGAVASIGAAVLPAVANIAIDVIKNAVGDDAATNGPPTGAVEAVLQVANIGPNPVLRDIARYRFDVSPTSVLAVEPKGGPSPLFTDVGDLPGYLAQVAPCLAAKGGGALLDLIQKNISNLNGFSSADLQTFMRRLLADAGEASVRLIAESVAECL